MAAPHYYTDLLRTAYREEFAAWEQQALCPKGCPPSEWHSRLRVASLISELRTGKTPDLDEAAVREELRGLILAQTKAKNAYDVYEPGELQAMHHNLQARTDWSELLRWLRNVRKETQRRYDLLMHQQHEQQGYSYPATSQDLAA